MENQNIHITTTEKELIIREGDALPVAHAKGIKITGTLGAPHQFLVGKTDNYHAVDCHLQIKKDTGIITLYLGDTNPHSESVIIGQLKKDSALDQWKINKEDRWTVQSFLKFIRTQKYFFSDPSECVALIESLKTWNAKVETVIQQHQDDKGNSLNSLEKKVSVIDVKTKFNLSIPIFQGYPKAKFTVEIGFDPKSNSVDLFLISDELFEVEIALREKLIQDELDKFDNFACSKIVIS